MKALMSHQAGPPESLTLEEVAAPVAGHRQMIVRVVACGVNFPDLLMVADKYQIRPPRPFAPGAEVAGVVESVGSDVRDFAIGDRVMSICSWGGMAEFVAVDEERSVRVPDFLPLDEAAALQLTYGTAYYALAACGGLRSGQGVLVLGAAGGVGLAAVELAKAMGAKIVAGVSSEEKASVALRHGADEAVIYDRGPLDRAARRALACRFRSTVVGSPDVIIDPVGGDYSEAALRAIQPGGRHAVIGFAAGIPEIPLNLVLLKNASIVSAGWGAVVAHEPARARQLIAEVVDLYRLGDIRPYISQRFTLAQAPEALATIGGRGATGKLIVEMV